ncbi:O-antigen ligase family protein [Pontimicrobium aquaticum]|uniref:O-antigen ligase domain-containing protein n=1 Tax=Pontimicrobium aquaticum TaxID=2565367 RepID=A0A4U0EN27_9FLAO|nr:O-antigen ligase family protein [Pontimicrobium aquaticum]TJY32911.1 O-antigen ligase domain-containing protein [Pontimicrobium aquaticum]
MNRLRKHNNELFLMLLHLALGIVIYTIPFSSKLVSLAVVFLSIFIVLVAKNKVLAVLIACAYVATSDVFFRMTGGLVFYELHKYLLIVLVLIGFVFDQVRVKGQVYLIYVGLLLLTIVFTSYDYTDAVRKMIAFNLAGPVSLGIVAFYFYKKKVTMQQLSKVLFFALLPVISLVVYLFLYSPSVKDVVTNTESNFATSGGFGPNQVATILGVGMFILFARLLFNKFKGIQSVLELLLLGFISFRGIVTFSRGGIFTAIAAMIILIILTYLRGKRTFRSKVLIVLFWTITLAALVWLLAANRTSGLIENRYANKNAMGVEKEDVSTGRKVLFLTELDAFIESPIVGIGVGKNKAYRFDKTGKVAASHNEISRLLAEHGALGILALSILVFLPLLLRIENSKNIYFYSFFIMWFLTINHSAMRIAFPSFIYGLCLLDVTFPKKVNVKTQSS